MSLRGETPAGVIWTPREGRVWWHWHLVGIAFI